MTYLLNAGYLSTNDIDSIEVHSWDGEAVLSFFGDGFEGGDTAMWGP
jgi:hypothetical protein